jgi:hypothetical protein
MVVWAEVGAVGRKVEGFRVVALMVWMRAWVVVLRAWWLVVRLGIVGWWVVRWLERWCWSR